MVTLDKTCRTVNGLDINYLEVYKNNIQKLLNNDLDLDLSFISSLQKDGRGNIAPVTIILPTLAMEAKLQCEEETSGKYDDTILTEYFMNLLEKKIEEAKDMLIERFNWICKQPMDSAKFMYENGTMAGYNEKEGRVNVVLSIKGGDKDSPKEFLSFYTDSVLGENKFYNAEVGDVVDSNQNKEATR